MGQRVVVLVDEYDKQISVRIEETETALQIRDSFKDTKKHQITQPACAPAVLRFCTAANSCLAYLENSWQKELTPNTPVYCALKKCAIT